MAPILSFLIYLFCLSLASVHAQTTTAPSTTPGTDTGTGTITATPSTGSSLPPSVTSGGGTGTGTLTGPPDVLLNVPTLSVGKIQLDVEELSANINLNAQVAGLVTLNAGIAVSIQKVNITIADVDAQLELKVRLGHLVDIVNRVFQSLDLNPLLISTLNNATSLVGDVVGDVVGEVDGLLGSVTQGGSTVSFVVDNLGNIVQQVSGTGVSSIVGNYLQNMTYTGVEQTLSSGLVQKQYSYSPLNALVDIVFNTAGQVVQATVESQSSATGTTTAASAPTAKVRR